MPSASELHLHSAMGHFLAGHAASAQCRPAAAYDISQGADAAATYLTESAAEIALLRLSSVAGNYTTSVSKRKFLNQ